MFDGIVGQKCVKACVGKFHPLFPFYLNSVDSLSTANFQPQHHERFHIMASGGILVITLLLGHIFHAAISRIAKVEEDYCNMMELKARAEAADVAKSQFLATVPHEIRTPMNGVLGMLQMLMDTDLDPNRLDYLPNGSTEPVIHRDVKSLNILFSYEFETQLEDFGFTSWATSAAPFLFQQRAGINVAIYYSTSGLHSAGIAYDVAASALVRAADVLSAATASSLMGKQRRKSLLITKHGFVHIENQSASLANIDSLLPKITCGLLKLTLGYASIVYCCSSLQPKALITRLVKDGTGRTTLVVVDGGSVYDVWPSCASNQAAQELLPLPYSFSQMGMLSGLLFQVCYGLVGSWTAYIISVHYIEYCNIREREGASFKKHDIQWFEVLAVLLGPYWKGIGLASNCILLLFGMVIQLIACASNIYSINDRLDKRTWAHNFGACCATIVFIPSFHNYRIGSFLGLGMTIYTALYLAIVAFVHGTWKPQKFKYIYLLATLHLINLEDKVVLMGTAMLRTRCYQLDQSESYGVD